MSTLPSSFPPCTHSFVAVKDREVVQKRFPQAKEGKEIHTRTGERANDLQTNSLMHLHVKRGSMVDARNVFDSMSMRNVVSWNIMILGYAKHEEGAHALHLYVRMNQEGLQLDDRTFVGALRACSSLGDRKGIGGKFAEICCLEKGRAIHSQVVKSAFDLDVFVGNTLVHMYAKGGSIKDAWNVFVELPCRDLVTWNTMIIGYADQGKSFLALELYARMQQEGIQSDARTFVGALKACSSLALQEEGKPVDGKFGKLGCLISGRAVHSQVLNTKFQSHAFVGNALVNMYVKCGSMEDAQCVFDELPHRDVFTWTTIILGYAEQEESGLALEIYAQMHLEGIQLDARTFVGGLKACSSLAVLEEGNQVNGKFVKQGCLEKGRAIHCQVIQGGFESDVFVGTCLVDMYAKCGSMEDARRVFDELPHRNVVTWNTMILGYAEQEESAQALQLYVWMHQEDVQPDARTFISALKACSCLVTLKEGTQVDGRFAKIGCLLKGRDIHSELVNSGLESEVFTGNALINMYAKCGSVEDARCVFDGMSHRDVVTWSTMILGYADQEERLLAFKLYAQMRQEGIQPDSRTFVATLKACNGGPEELTKKACLTKGRAIHFNVLYSDFESDVFVGNVLVNMYAKCGSMEDAQCVFDELPHHDAVTWTTMILGYVDQEQCVLALDLYSQMHQKGVQLDARTYVGGLKACSSLAELEVGKQVEGKFVKIGCLVKGREIHSQLVKSGFESDLFVETTLADMYVKCGSMDEAWCLLEETPYPNVATYNTLIMACAQQQESALALQLYARVYQGGIQPNARTFVGVLMACSSLAALEEGKQAEGKFARTVCLAKGGAIYSQIMKAGFEWDGFIGNALVNMYAKCRNMEDAQCIFDSLPHRDVVTWNTMILGYAEQKESVLALELYAQMHQDGIEPDTRTFVGALKACYSLAALNEGEQVDGKLFLVKGRAIFSQLVNSGFESDVFVANTLVSMYVKCRSMEDARRVFDALPDRDVITWTNMILGYAEQEESEEAFRLYVQMQKQGLSPTAPTFVAILKACGNRSALESGKELHSQITSAGYETNTTVATSLIDMYAKCGSMIDAQLLFDALPTRDVVAWSTLIAGYARQGENKLVFDLFERMRQEGIQPNGFTFLSVLTVCSHVGLVDKGQEYFQIMTKQYAIIPTIEHYTCIVDILGRVGQLYHAVEMVDGMPFQPDDIIWLTVLGACQKWMNVEVGRHAFKALSRFDKQLPVAYILMANIYADAHLWEERDKIQAMRRDAQPMEEELVD